MNHETHEIPENRELKRCAQRTDNFIDPVNQAVVSSFSPFVCFVSFVVPTVFSKLNGPPNFSTLQPFNPLTR